jgi:hypothetical protein
MFGAPPSSPGPMNTLPSGFGSMNGPSFNSNYMPSRTMPAPISNNPNLIPGTLPGIQPNMRPNMMSGTGPGVFPSAPRSVSPQPYGSRTLSPQFNPLGPNPLINNQYSRNIIPPSQPVLGGRSRLGIQFNN